MRWIKAAWRDPVLSGVLVGVILSSAWGGVWHHLSAASLSFWSFLQSQSGAPVWLVLLLAVAGVLSLATILRRVLHAFGLFAHGKTRKLNDVEAKVMACVALSEGAMYPSTRQIAGALKSQIVVIEHAVDELAKMNLLDTMYGDAGRLCWLSVEGRAYVVKHNAPV